MPWKSKKGKSHDGRNRRNTAVAWTVHGRDRGKTRCMFLDDSGSFTSKCSCNGTIKCLWKNEIKEKLILVQNSFEEHTYFFLCNVGFIWIFMTLPLCGFQIFVCQNKLVFEFHFPSIFKNTLQGRSLTYNVFEIFHVYFKRFQNVLEAFCLNITAEVPLFVALQRPLRPSKAMT